jgi:hypothetical protein
VKHRFAVFAVDGDFEWGFVLPSPWVDIYMVDFIFLSATQRKDE